MDYFWLGGPFLTFVADGCEWRIPAVHSHRHLGAVCTVTASMDAEIRNRIAAAVGAIVEVDQTLRCGLGL